MKNYLTLAFVLIVLGCLLAATPSLSRALVSQLGVYLAHSTAEQNTRTLPADLFLEWGSYVDPEGRFSLVYPTNFSTSTLTPGAMVSFAVPQSYREGTNLWSAVVNVYVKDPLSIPDPEFIVSTQETTIVGTNTPYLYRTGGDSGAGQRANLKQYITIPHSTSLYLIELVVITLNRETYEKPPQEFNPRQIERIFSQMVEGFVFGDSLAF